MKKQPKFKAVIEEKIEVHLKGDGSYYTAKNMKDAERLAKKIETEAKEEWKRDNDKEKKRIKSLVDLNHNMDNYLKLLQRKLWYLHRRDKKKAEDLKIIVNEIKGILEGKLKVKYIPSYIDDRGNYCIDEVKG